MRRHIWMVLGCVACNGSTWPPEDPGYVDHLIGSEHLYLRPGFRIAEYATVTGGMRNIAVGPSGDVYVGTITAGHIVRLRDTDTDGVADTQDTLLTGLLRPFGLAFRGDTLYFAEENRVSRLDPGATVAVTVIPSLPSGAGHSSRTIAFGPDGRLYVSVGSSCNVCVETDSFRASILQFEADGGSGRVFGRGLRNSVGMAFHPVTGALWATNNDRDDLGKRDTVLTDDLPPERINIIHYGAWYGWPQCYLPHQANPEFPTANCSGVEPPAIAFQAHSAPLGIAFYTASAFPSQYRGDAFVAYHGSWNRTVPTGAKVVQVFARSGQPTGIVDFVFGWQRPDGTRWGRPVAVALLPDGSLLISDDVGRRIWRVYYEG